MKKINESQLLDRVRGLREYISIVEANNGPWPEGSPQAAAYSKMSPEDQKFLGGANPLDPAILNRAPNKGKPAAAPAAPAAPTGTTAQGDDAGNTTITKPDGSMQVVGPDGNVIPPGGGRQQPTQAGKPAAPQAATPTAAPKVNYEKDFPAATAKELQTKLNAVGEKLTVDGMMGPATRAAMARHPEITTNPNAAAPAAQAGRQTPAAAPVDTSDPLAANNAPYTGAPPRAAAPNASANGANDGDAGEAAAQANMQAAAATANAADGPSTGGPGMPNDRTRAQVANNGATSMNAPPSRQAQQLAGGTRAMEEGVSYRDELALARIVQLARGR